MATAKKKAAKKVATKKKATTATKSSIRKDVERKNAARSKAQAVGIEFVPPRRKQASNSKIEIEKLSLDPEFAQALLDNTPPDKQRPLKKRLVDKYAADMLSGMWASNGEPIQLTPELELINGQHRCAAVVMSGVTLPDIVIETLYDPSAITTLDQGATRTLRDAMKMSGANPVEVVVSAGILYENADFHHRQLSTPQKMAIVLAHPKLETIKKLNSGRLNAGFMAAAVRALKVNEPDALKFFPAVFGKEPLIDGEFCQQAHTLAQWLINAKSDPMKRKTGEPWKRECVVRAIYAWNAWRKGTSLRKSTYRLDAPVPEMV